MSDESGKMHGRGEQPADRPGGLTPAQWEAIHETGCSLLVSAAAGAGKTTVLAERCVALVCDVPEAQRCDIDRLLVVTFTDAAAEEMRTRIRGALRRRLDERPEDERLQRQIHLLDCASISTIHSFCKTLIERYFPQAEVDPQAAVLSEEEADLLRDEVLDDLFVSLYASSTPEATAFQAFVDDYGAGEDARVGAVVLRVHGFISTLPEPMRWLDESLRRSRVDGPESLLAELHPCQCRRLGAELRAQMEYCLHLSAAIRAAWPVAEMHADSVSEHYFVLKKWLEALDPQRPESWEGVAGEIRGFQLKWVTRRPLKLSEEDKAAFDAAKEQRDKLKVHFERRLRERLCAFTAAEYREGLERVAPHARTLHYLVREFDRLYTQAKAAQAVVDFNDLQRKAMRLLCAAGDTSRPSDVARHLQGRYRYVLVDEFQDVDPLQEAILRLVSRESAEPPEGNLFTVGDIKQSIYRFRLAEPGLFTARADAFARDTNGTAGRDATSPRGKGRGGQGDAGPPTHGGRDGRDPVQGGRDTRPPASGEQEARPPLGRVITLQDNFRSRAGVIEGINRVFETLMSREFGGSDYDEQARLHAGAVYPATADGPMFDRPAIEMHLLEPVTERTRAGGAGEADGGESEPAEEEPTGAPPPEDELEGIEREAYLIGRLVRHWMGQGKVGQRWNIGGKPEAPGGAPTARPIEYRDIVILLRSLRFKAEPIADVLRRMGVPVRIERQTAAMNTTEFRDCVNLLRLLDNAQQDVPLAAVLRSPILGTAFNASELLTMRLSCREGPFHAAVRRYATEGDDAGLRERLRAFGAKLERYRTRIQRMAVADVLWEIYEEADYLAYVCGLPDGMRRREHLVRLHELARQFGRFSRQGLRRFLHFLDDVAERERQPRQAGVGGSEDCVRIMTVHASKGLEFPVVVLADLQKRFNLEEARGAVLVDRRYGIALRASDAEKRILYPTLAHQLAADETVRESLSEELRVLYVALTRAREHLVLIGRMPPSRVALCQAMQRAREATGSRAAERAALPRLELESAYCALDWLMAAVSAAPANEVHWKDGRASGGQRLFEVATYPRAATDQWQIPAAVEPARAEALGRMARLEPLPADEPVEGAAEARQLVTAIGEEYPARLMTKIPGRLAVGELKRRWDGARETDERVPRGENYPDAFSAAVPGVENHPVTFSAAARGSATHRFLQLVDLSAACDLANLKRQLAALTDAGRIAPTEAEAVLVESAAWFFDTPLGRRIREGAANVRRELAFDARVPPERYDPRVVGRDTRDTILVRGVVDLVLETTDGVEIVDYKTDTVAAQNCRPRAEAYRSQVDIYATAMQNAYRRPVTRRWLVFLHARVVVEV